MQLGHVMNDCDRQFLSKCRCQTHDFNKEDSFSASSRGSLVLIVYVIYTGTALGFVALYAEKQLVFALTSHLKLQPVN